MKIVDHLNLAKLCLQNLPCGGIGADGPTWEELDDVAERCEYFDDDAIYDLGQRAWLHIDAAQKAEKP